MSRTNYVQLVGEIWMPNITAAKEYDLSEWDIQNLNEIADERSLNRSPGEIVQEGIIREDIAEWLTTNSGDFRAVTDFCACIDGIEIDWEDVENAFIYNDCMNCGEGD